MTESKLHKMVNKLDHVLNMALDKSCPVSKARSIDLNNPRWTPQLQDMGHKVTKTYDKYKNDRRNDALKKQYKKQQRGYKKLKRKAKKTYENIENESVINKEAIAKKIKNLTTSIQPKFTTLKVPTGEYTEFGKETCEEMMAKHSPPHTHSKNVFC